MHKYASYSADQLEELFANFLVSLWSYSGVSTFARNQKCFEKEYIYRERSLQSATTIAGKAYHKALELYFKNLQSTGKHTSIVDMQLEAYNFIDSVGIEEWKLQKTTPTIADCQTKANKIATALIANFEHEKGIYLDDLDEIIAVEEKCVEWLTIYGVDIPLPCASIQDMVVRQKSDEQGESRIVVRDHKSVLSFSDEDEAAFTRGQQAIVYAKSIEAKLGVSVDEVQFFENKFSKNSDGSPQIKMFSIVLDKDTRMLYEAMLYESLRAMLNAISDPDYVYIVNNSDNFVDKKELWLFWAKTLVAEVNDFNIPEAKKPLIEKRLKKIRDASLASINPKTIAKFKENISQFITYDLTDKDMTNAQKIEYILRTLNVPVEVQHELCGYSANTYLLEASLGTKMSKIMQYQLDIAKALNVQSVRINSDLVLYDGKAYIGIEAPKTRAEDLLFDLKYLAGHKLPIGIDNYGKLVIWDLDNHSTPHMLICGATGSGKSVSIASTIHYAKAAGVTDIKIFDPKYEFCKLAGNGIEVYNEIEQIEAEMKKLVEDMQARVKNGFDGRKTLIIFDEFADAVSAARSGKELDINAWVQTGTYAQKIVNGELVDGGIKQEFKTTGRDKSLEENLKILLQKGRSLGFHVVAATQRASTKVITGDAKVNFPVLVCFRVPKEVDSKVVLDEAGAESLAGKGDGLMRSPEYQGLVRFQGFFKFII